MNFTHYNPVKIIETDNFWKEAIDDSCESILVICSERFKASKQFQELKDTEIDVFHPQKGNPTKQYCDKITKETFAGKWYDAVIAIGGGAIMDFAKILRTRILIDADLICIPTNFGSSSELTPWATIWNHEENKKLSEATFFAEKAIYDQQLMESMNVQQKIIGGLDVLSHAFDSMWSKNSNVISMSYAFIARNLLFNGLREVESKESLSTLRLSSMYAGLAFSNTTTSLSHSISYPLTLRYSIPHGIAAGITLSGILKRFPGSSKILEVLDEVLMPVRKNIAFNLECYGVELSDLPLIAKEALSSTRANNFRYDITEKNVVEILKGCY